MIAEHPASDCQDVHFLAHKLHSFAVMIYLMNSCLSLLSHMIYYALLCPSPIDQPSAIQQALTDSLLLHFELDLASLFRHWDPI
jgi:hypothetical protein